MINSKQILSTGMQTVLANTSLVIPIDAGLQNSFFVCDQISVFATQSLATFLYFDIKISGSNDRLSSNPISSQGFINRNSIYSSNNDSFSRENKKPIFIVKGSEKILITFYCDTAPVSAGLSLFGYYVDKYAHNIIDIPGTPVNILNTL